MIGRATVLGSGNRVLAIIPDGALLGEAVLTDGGQPGIALTPAEPGQVASVLVLGAQYVDVEGADDLGPGAVAEGDVVYYRAERPRLSKRASGVPFGRAVGAVEAGETKTIRVDFP